MKQFCTPSGHGIKILTLIPDHFFRHANGRQRRAKFVRDIRDEALLEPRELVIFINFLLKRFGHVIKSTPKICHLIATAGITAVNSNIKISFSKLPCRCRSTTYRSQDVIDQDEGDDRNQQQERNPGEDQDSHDGINAFLVCLKRIDDIQLVGPCSRYLNVCPHKDCRHSLARITHGRNRD